MFFVIVVQRSKKTNTFELLFVLTLTIKWTSFTAPCLMNPHAPRTNPPVCTQVAQRALKLPSSGEGLLFYQFEGIHNARSFKQLYRSRMNELELDAHTKDRIIAESNRAFAFNMEVRPDIRGN